MCRGTYYYQAHRRGHASRCGHSSRAHSLGDFPAGHELTRASEPRPMGGADAPAPSLFTCPQLCHQGDLLSITNCPLRWRPRALRAFPRGSANASPNSARARSGTPGTVFVRLTEGTHGGTRKIEVAIMKIVVMGGSGLFGSKLVTKLREHEPCSASAGLGTWQCK